MFYINTIPVQCRNEAAKTVNKQDLQILYRNGYCDMRPAWEHVSYCNSTGHVDIN